MSSEAGRYRHRSVEVQAIQFAGTPESCKAVSEFLAPQVVGWNFDKSSGGRIYIPTFLFADFKPGDWIVGNAPGEFRVLTDERFAVTYEPAHQPEEQPQGEEQDQAERKELARQAFVAGAEFAGVDLEEPDAQFERHWQEQLGHAADSTHPESPAPLQGGGG